MEFLIDKLLNKKVTQPLKHDKGSLGEMFDMLVVKTINDLEKLKEDVKEAFSIDEEDVEEGDLVFSHRDIILIDKKSIPALTIFEFKPELAPYIHSRLYEPPLKDQFTYVKIIELQEMIKVVNDLNITRLEGCQENGIGSILIEHLKERIQVLKSNITITQLKNTIENNKYEFPPQDPEDL